MSIDVFATLNGKRVAVGGQFPRSHIVDRKLSREFKKAARAVGWVFGAYDADLPLGGLDLYESVREVRRVLGAKHGFKEEYTSQETASAKSVWPRFMNMEQACARVFLKVCAANNLGVTIR